MPAIQLTPAQRKEHRAEAHHLDPVVMIGGDGPDGRRQKRNRRGPQGPRLMKVRVFSDDRAERETISRPWPTSSMPPRSSTSASCWCSGGQAAQGTCRRRRPQARPARHQSAASTASAPASAPEVKTLRVGNQRLTPGRQRQTAPRSPGRPASENAVKPDALPADRGGQAPALPCTD